MSTDPWDQDELDAEEPRTRFYTPAQLLADSPEATRTLSPTEQGRLMASTGAAAAPPVLVTPTAPATRPTRPPMPPPLPIMRPPFAAAPTETGGASSPELPPQSEHERTPPALHSTRAAAAMVESLAGLQAAQGHLRQCGLASPDLAVAERLVLGVLESAHLRGWAP